MVIDIIIIEFLAKEATMPKMYLPCYKLLYQQGMVLYGLYYGLYLYSTFLLPKTPMSTCHKVLNNCHGVDALLQSSLFFHSRSILRVLYVLQFGIPHVFPHLFRFLVFRHVKYIFNDSLNIFLIFAVINSFKPCICFLVNYCLTRKFMKAVAQMHKLIIYIFAQFFYAALGKVLVGSALCQR